jgi:hypothetical protein
MAKVHWSNIFGGNWDTASNWSSGEVPTAADNVLIGFPTFVTSDGNVLINSIGTWGGSVLTITGESLFTTTNGTGSSKNSGIIQVKDNSTLQIGQGTFDNAGSVILGASLNVIEIDSDVVLDGGGTIVMATGPKSGNAIRGENYYSNSNIVLDNVDNDIAGSGQISGLFFDNETNGVLETNANSVAGTLELLNTNLPGQGFENFGQVKADDGGTLELYGMSGSPAFYNFGTITVNSTGDATHLEIGGDVKLKGGGILVLSDNFNNFVSTDGYAATLDNVDNTIFGSGSFDDARLKLINQAHGSIIADNANASLQIITDTLTNAGSLMADDNATLVITGAVKNSGDIVALGGNIMIGGGVTGSGQAQIDSNSQLRLEGASNQVAVTFENNASDNGALLLGFGGSGATDFSGTVAGMYSDGTNSDTLGLLNLNYASGVHWSFHENAGGTGGALNVNDGLGNIADIALLGQYMTANGVADSSTSNLFQVSSDHLTNSTGTLVTTSFHG